MAQLLIVSDIACFMQIIAPDRAGLIQERDRILHRLLAEHAHEWEGQRGLHRLFIRIKIEFWARRETGREMQRVLRNSQSPG